MSSACCTSQKLPKVKRLEALTRVYAALADPTRLRILSLLANGEICVCHLHASLDVPQPTASRHLAYLRRSGLVDARRRLDALPRGRDHRPVVGAVVKAARTRSPILKFARKTSAGCSIALKASRSLSVRVRSTRRSQM
jgi:ArsR family transcriptional regulator